MSGRRGAPPRSAPPPDLSRVPWHPAFVEAPRLELERHGDALEIISEFQLTSEPPQIDAVIVKKTRDSIPGKNIARIFRHDNIVEYKSPGDYVPVDDFYKVYGYACFYSSMKKAPITGITLSFVESRYPRELSAHIKEIRGYAVEETDPGIYSVRGDILPIQVIDSRRLSEDENMWLKNLSDSLDIESGRRIAEKIEGLGKEARIRAYLYAIARANTAIIQEVAKMSGGMAVFERALEEVGLTAKWEARGEARGEERRPVKIAKNLLADGFSPEQAAKLAELDIETVRALQK